MAITVCPVTPGFVAEIGDIDLSTPLEPADLLAVKEAFTTYAVLIFPDQHLSQDQHLDFARNFGPLETTIALFRKDAKLRLRKEFADVSNLDADSKVWGENSRRRMFELGNRLWHTDSSFKRLPARASLLYARSIPPVGGHTEFADERAAYDALPEDMRRRLQVYTHRWRVHDLVIWDDRCTMHRGTGFDDLRWQRDLQRATVSDIANSCEQEGIAVAAA